MTTHVPGPDAAPLHRRNASNFRTLFESASDGILILENDAVADCNPRAAELFELCREEIIGGHPADWSPQQQADGSDSLSRLQGIIAAARSGQPQSFGWLFRRRDGSVFDAEINLYCVGNGSTSRTILMLRDISSFKRIQADLQSNSARLKAAHLELISLYQDLAESEEAIAHQTAELKASEKKLEFSEQRYQLAVDASNDAIWEVDLSSDELTFSAQWLERFGLPVNARFQRRLWLECVHPEDLSGMEAALSAHLNGRSPRYDAEYRARTLDGEYLWLQARGKALRNGAGVPERLVGALTDITDRKQREAQIYQMAYYDQLTGLPNRRRLELLLEEERLSRMRRGALLYIDLDNFKLINDSAGHSCGDELIARVAEKLAAAVGPAHILARVGGDEFIVVLSGISERTFVDAFSQRLISLFSAPFPSRGQLFYLSVSIGIALIPENGTVLEDLLKNADNALHRAKEAGWSNYRFFEQSMQERLVRRIALETRLRDAVRSKEEFQMFYQPQADARTGRIVGMESLIRWHSPGHGDFSPASFIPVAEECGLIGDIGDWGLRSACRFCRCLHDAGHPGMRVSVNVSVKQLAQADYVETVAAALVETGLPPSSLELEITESMLIQAFESKVKKLSALRSMGIRTALDDFGTGYSSLTYLQQLPIHTLKIDPTFVSRMLHESSTRIIIESIIALAHRLGISVVGEGIETPEQKDELIRSGCDILQGYLISQPMPQSTLAAWLTGSE